MLRQLIALLDFVLSLTPAESGQGIVEYALIIFLFTMAVVVFVASFGTTLQTTYGYIAAAFP